MNKLIKKTYMNSPFWLKKIFANVEGIRRNYYRRSGSYIRYYNTIQIERIFEEYNLKDQLEKFNNLLRYVKDKIPFYKEYLHFDYLNSINDIEKMIVSSIVRNFPSGPHWTKLLCAWLRYAEEYLS